MNTSSQHIFWRLMWKEYRTQRGLWLGIAGLALLLQAIIILIWRDQQGRFGLVPTMYNASLLFTSLFALTSCAVLFAAEKEDGTYDLLRSLPISPQRLFLGKMAFCLVGSLAMAHLLAGLVWLISLVFSLRGGVTNAVVAQHALYFGLTITVGLFFSLKFSRVINVIIATVVTTIALNFNGYHWLQLGGMAGFLLADVWLVRRWFFDAQPLSESIGRLLPFSLTWREKVHAERWARTEVAAPWWRQLKRTLWLEWRQVRSVLLTWFPAALFLLFISPWVDELNAFDFSNVIMPLAPLFLGLMMFRGHQREHRVRFLTENGIPPQIVWVSAQVVWFTATVLMVFGLAAMHAVGLMVKSGPRTGIVYADMATALDSGPYTFYLDHFFTSQWGSVAGFYLWFALLSFIAGHVCSLKFEKTAIATFVGLVFAGVAFVWLSLIVRLPVPYWLGAVPIALIWLGVSFFGLRRWSLEQRTWKTITCTVVVLFALHTIHLGAIACYRTIESRNWPQVNTWVADITSRYEPITGFATVDGRHASTNPYVVVAKRITEYPLRSPEIGKALRDNPEARQKALSNWVDENQAALASLIAVIESDDKPDPRHFHDDDLWRSGELLIVAANEYARAGELDRALATFRHFFEFNEKTALDFRLHQHAVDDFRFLRTMHVPMHTTLPYPHIVDWAAQEEQTPERLREAIAMVRQYRLTPNDVQHAWDADWAQNRWLLQHEWLQSLGPSNSYSNLLALLPWEQSRRLRLLDAYAFSMRYPLANEVPGGFFHQEDQSWRNRVHQHRQLLNNQSISFSFSSRDVDRAARNAMGTINRDAIEALELMIDAESSFRVCLLRLELMAQRLETGSLPNRLDGVLKPYGPQEQRLVGGGAGAPAGSMRAVDLTKLEPIHLIDPWNGGPYEYYPNGLHADVFAIEGHDVAEPVIQVNRPFLKADTGDATQIVPYRTDDGVRFTLQTLRPHFRIHATLTDGIFPIPSAPNTGE